ncbi:hypothetical protein [Candidatus Leptofilum sp.]|uniref:hypothetical protein n=1 Tax=Candidatus Leptofilum sp. TaxID=3241576 RepID=UPI003B5CF0E0
MIQKKESARSSLSIRDFGYLIAMMILGISIGLLLYPALSYPAVWQWGAAFLAVILMALTAPALRRKK